MPNKNSDSIESTSPTFWAQQVVKYRYACLLLAGVLTIVLGYQATKLQFNFSTDNIYLSSDPAYHSYKDKFITNFGDTSGAIMVGVEGDLKSLKAQDALWELHNALEAVPTVNAVHSLVNLELPVLKDGVSFAEPIFDKHGKTSIEKLKQARLNDLYNGTFINSNLNAAMLVVKTPQFHGDQPSKEKLAFNIEQTVAQIAGKYPKLQFHLTGKIILQEATIQVLKKDQLKFIPLVVALMALLLWISFRNLRGVVLPFVATGTATIWALGYLVLIGHPLDIVNNAIVVLLLVISIADAVHIISRYEDEFTNERKRNLGGSPDKKRIVARTVEAMTLPCLLTTATTSLGFASSWAADVEIIRNFGLDAAVGILGAFLATMLILPACLTILPPPKKRQLQHERANKRKWSIDHILENITHFSLKFSKPIISVAIVLAIVFSFSAKDISAKEMLAGELPEESPSVVALDFIDKHFNGIMTFEILLEGNPNVILDPSTLKLADKIARHVETIPPYPKVSSYGQILMASDEFLTGEKTLPLHQWSDEKVAEILLLLDMEPPEKIRELKQTYFGPNNRIYRLSGLLKNTGTQSIGYFQETADAYLKSIRPQNLDIFLTGSSLVSAKALGNIIEDMSASLILAIITIFIFIMLLFRSFKLAFIALFPNLLPIVITVGTMQFFGINLRVATVIIFSMSLGIAVDACIHLISRFKEESAGKHFNSKQSLEQILKRTIIGAGRPVVYSTLMLLVGFSALFFSEFYALRDFAILSSITLSTALLIDLYLLPAMLYLFDPKL